MKQPNSLPTVLTACLLAATLVGCTAQSESDGQEEAATGMLSTVNGEYDGSGPVTIALDADVQEAQGLDPQSAATARSWSIYGLVYETLVTVDKDMKIVPGLASSWKQTDDTTYRFTLDNDVKFSNGRSLRVEDVTKSLKRLLESQSVWAGQMGPVQSISAINDSTVEIKLKEPYAPFLAALANTPAAILPMEEIEAGTIDPVTDMLGTGPFTLASHRQNESWTFEKNPKYRDSESVSITKLNIAVSGQETTRQAAMRDGSVSLANFNNVDSLRTLRGDGISTHNQLQSDFYYLLVNSQRDRKGPLGDNDFRFAINSTLSRHDIADISLGGLSEPTGVTPSNLPGACDPDALPSAQLDDSEIAALVDASDYNGEDLHLLIYTSEPILGQMAQLIQQQLKKVGITVVIDQLDYASYSERVLTSSPGEFDLALGWFAGYADASMVANWWNPKRAGFSAGFAGNHSDLNALIDESNGETDLDARKSTLTQLCETADKYSEMVPLVHRPSVVATDDSRLSLGLYVNEGYGDFLRNLPTARITAGE
ncbi:ABC transporter substrate-binding protein [Brevibacterium sp. FAM 24638]|uniref:ABC transporter substrate-binding protein n=1 Tax=unclassified Brevibacterium TaxID=2614124 RepID=UPI003C7B418D